LNSNELLKCIGCGFCLNVCPQYQKWHDEIHSPRGLVRILLHCKSNNLTLPMDIIQSCVDCCYCHDACPVGIDFAKGFSLNNLSGNDFNRGVLSNELDA